ncbi:hypothetical protein BJY04DRAFT_216723 [Aspergillus karnatakaensis]|uniref:uncharacterized protein n=1 Tax=Aspergillus karnatakaensis TaxID=1810916 RepID=UPI003CCCB3AD
MSDHEAPIDALADAPTVHDDAPETTSNGVDGKSLSAKLTQAVEDKDINEAKKILESQEALGQKAISDVDRIDSLTPFLDAVYSEHLEMVEMFLSHKAELASQKDELGHNAFHHAAGNDQTEVMEALLRMNAALLNTRGLLQWTALIRASYEGKLKAVGYLLSKGAEIAARDVYGKDALYIAASKGHCDVVQALFEGGARVIALPPFVENAPHAACYKGHVKYGPQRIMQHTKFHSLSSLRDYLGRRVDEGYRSQHIEPKSMGLSTPEAEEEHQVPAGEYELRWIHLPINDLQALENLTVAISQERNVPNKEHRPLAEFLRRSWAQLPAGGKKAYMKPHCVQQEPDSEARGTFTPKSHLKKATDPLKQPTNELVNSSGIYRGARVALYMPYISWTLPPPPDVDPLRASSERMVNDNHMQPEIVPEHTSMTLDQYYYASLDNTEERDKDQVLSRYITKIKQQVKGDDTKHDTNCNAPENNAAHTPDTPTEILVVNQLWLWGLDDKTLIIGTTREAPGSDNSFMQNMLDALRSQSKGSEVSAQSMIELILSVSVGYFDRRRIDVNGTKVSPLEVFSNSIRLVRNQEATLYQSFKESVNAAKNQRLSRMERTKNAASTDDKSQGEHDNEHQDITEETELLQEIKDICDELNILKNLAEDQERVWRVACKSKLASHSLSTYTTPTEVKDNIMEMIHEAKVVRQSIDSLLDLKQKQANLIEARFARQQAENTAKQAETTARQAENSARQSEIIMVFPMVTIVFLPLSFLTSLFALNISSFPHKGDEVAYQGWWIFPILFGTSAIVSGLFMIVAFQASAFKGFKEMDWSQRKETIKQMFQRTNTAPVAPDSEKKQEQSVHGDTNV